MAIRACSAVFIATIFARSPRAGPGGRLAAARGAVLIDGLLAARAQMALSLMFHIVFAAIGIALPLLMVIAEGLGLRRHDPVYREVARAWARGAAIFFAVGAVSGTVLSFELGLLWPAFMARAGALIGLPFALEGFAFFAEAIFLGIYLYGWDRVPPRAHLAAGAVVAASGAASAVFVLAVNGFMNAPGGFAIGPKGEWTNLDPIAAMANPFWLPNAVHMLLGAYTATGFGAAGLHALALRRDPSSERHRRALHIALAVGAVAALLQPISGDEVARLVHRLQPAKLAALEGQFQTEACAPFRIGGFPFPQEGETRYALEIPCGLSLLAARDPHAVIEGLGAFPADARPDPRPVHVAFQVMIGIGTLLAGLGVWAAWLAWRRGGRFAEQRAFSAALVAAAPLGFVAIEAGWIVTEVGRQPWIIQGVMRVGDAVTPLPWLWAPLVLFGSVYLGLAWVVVRLMRRVVMR
jgi:cytochrome d ubiquinol oxidase subunit I